MTSPLWQFHSSVSDARQQQLMGCKAFADLVGFVMLDARVINAMWESSRRKDLAAASCRRAAFRIEVKSWLYDAFFNSPVGYRAQYARSPGLGCRQNREFLVALAPRLLQFAADLPVHDVGGLTRSLDGAGAKVWIDEEEVVAQLDGPPEIDYEPWRERSVIRGDGITAGLRAPVGHEFVVYGEWIDRTGEMHPDPNKLMRAQEIHDIGWT